MVSVWLVVVLVSVVLVCCGVVVVVVDAWPVVVWAFAGAAGVAGAGVLEPGAGRPVGDPGAPLAWPDVVVPTAADDGTAQSAG